MPSSNPAATPRPFAWTTLPLDYSRERAEGFVSEYAPGWWERGDGATWVIADSDDNYAGQLDLRSGPAGQGGGRCRLHHRPARPRPGYMTAALRAAVRFGFEELDLERIEWRAHVGNDASRRVAEKAGFQFEGILRKGCAQRGERHDGWLAAILKGELA